jgi:hypothetical protein
MMSHNILTHDIMIADLLNETLCSFILQERREPGLAGALVPYMPEMFSR